MPDPVVVQEQPLQGGHVREGAGFEVLDLVVVEVSARGTAMNFDLL